MDGSRGEEARPVLPVQELVSGNRAAEGNVPTRFVAGAHDDALATAAAPVPVIDLSRLCRPDGAGTNADEAAKLRLALESWWDRLYLQLEPENDQNLLLWPTHPQRFKDVLHKFSAECTSVKDQLLPAMAMVLQLDDDYFSNQFGDKRETYARYSYYPPCPRPELVFGLRPHSDGTFISVLMVDNNVGGLQVLRDGVWYDVPTRPHTLLVNLGDQMEIISNGIFKSPVHRMVANVQKERLSVGLFYSVDPERDLEPASQLVHEKWQALYRKVKARDYKAGLFQYFSQGRRVIDTVKMYSSPWLTPCCDL